MKTTLKRTVTAAMLVAMTVVLSSFAVPIGASKCYPIQHLVNVVCAVFLGPAYGVMAAFCASLIRNLMGTGSLLAFPGSMVGAFLCGMAYKKTGRLVFTYVGEVVGIGVTGGMLCFPVAEALKRFRPEHAVLDPVMVSTSGRRLMDEDAVWAVIRNLIPHVTVLTPNVKPKFCLIGWRKGGRSAATGIWRMLQRPLGAQWTFLCF